jgi:hypothetical protein
MKRTRQTVRAGKKGIRKYPDEYGGKLPYVRQYYDRQRKRRTTTIEIIVCGKEWVPKKIPPKTVVNVRVAWGESGIAGKIKALGGIWNKEGRVWEIPFGKAKDPGLQTRLVR